MSTMRTYSELIKRPTFEERFRYLALQGSVARDTFGSLRYLNQQFYNSLTWKKIRDEVILRDNGCDLAVEDRTIYGHILIHHLNPITPEDFKRQTDRLLNPEYLICTTHQTHNAIHYGDENQLQKLPQERKPNDTCPWRR